MSFNFTVNSTRFTTFSLLFQLKAENTSTKKQPTTIEHGCRRRPPVFKRAPRLFPIGYTKFHHHTLIPTVPHKPQGQ